MHTNRFINPVQTLANSLSNLYSSRLTTIPRPGLDSEQRAELIKKSEKLYREIRSGNLDFVTDTLSSHIILLNNVISVCHGKAKSSGYFREYTELSVKATDQLRKSALALAQIKNVIIGIENLTLQQNNYIQLNQQQTSNEEVINAKTKITTKE